MSFSGLAEKTVRNIKNLAKKTFDKIFFFLKKPEEEDEVEVPDTWVKKERIAGPGKSKGVLKIKQGKVVVSDRKVYHWPWIRNFKRILAGFLLMANFVFSQFMIASAGVQTVAIFFFLNAFILLDYLWKTRRESS